MEGNKIEQLKQFLYEEKIERRQYSASKMIEVILEEIERLGIEKEYKSLKEKEGKFAEWCNENDWIYDDAIYRWCKKYNQIIKKTTSELMEEYEIFKQTNL